MVQVVVGHAGGMSMPFVFCAILAFLLLVSPAVAGMHRLRGPGFHIVLDDSCTTRDQTDRSVWIDCAPDGKSVIFLAQKFWNHDLPKTDVSQDLTSLATKEVRFVLKGTAWEALTDRVWVLPQLKVGDRLFTIAGYLCPTVPGPAGCWSAADKAIGLKIVQATDGGTVVLFAMGDWIEEEKLVGKLVTTRKGFPETTEAMIDSFTRILD